MLVYCFGVGGYSLSHLFIFLKNKWHVDILKNLSHFLLQFANVYESAEHKE